MGEERIFAAVFFLVGLCVTVLLGRIPGFLVGGTMAGLVYLVMNPGSTRIVVLLLLCVAGIAMTVHSGVTRAFLVDDIAQLLSAQGRLSLFAGFGIAGCVSVSALSVLACAALCWRYCRPLTATIRRDGAV